MRRLLELMSVAVAVAIPLWIRQFRVERAQARFLRDYARSTNDDLNSWLRGSKDAIEKAMREALR